MLDDPALPRGKAELRAVALQMLGEAYMGVKKDSDAAASGPGANIKGEDSEYVRIDTKSSRARDGQGRGHAPGPSYEGRGGRFS